MEELLCKSGGMVSNPDTVTSELCELSHYSFWTSVPSPCKGNDQIIGLHKSLTADLLEQMILTEFSQIINKFLNRFLDKFLNSAKITYYYFMWEYYSGI